MIDAFTASAMVGAATKGNSDQLADLYKEMNSKADGGPSAEARAFFEKHQGKPCTVTGTSHEGIVHKLNEATAGFYPGSRYPIYVKITNGEAVGDVFEYGLDQVAVKE